MYKEMMDTIGLVNTVDPELGAAMTAGETMFSLAMSSMFWR